MGKITDKSPFSRQNSGISPAKREKASGKGVGEYLVKPDYVTFTLTAETKNVDSAKAVATHAGKIEKIGVILDNLKGKFYQPARRSRRNTFTAPRSAPPRPP